MIDFFRRKPKKKKKFVFFIILISGVILCLQQNFLMMFDISDRFLTTTTTATTRTQTTTTTTTTAMMISSSSSNNNISSSLSSIEIEIEMAKADNIETFNCGYTKCFITFVHEQETYNKVGYIIAQDNRTWRNNFQIGFDKSWDIASQIQNKFNSHNVSTLLLGPSQQIYKNDDGFIHQINVLMKVGNENFPNKVKNFTSRQPLIVQKSLVIPKPNHFWHYKDKTTKQLSTYLEFIQSHVTNINQFETNLFHDLEVTKQIIDLFPCLCLDFQFLIDYTGKIHHLDLDRCFDDESRRTPESHPAAPSHTKEEILKFIDTLITKYQMAIMEVKL